MFKKLVLFFMAVCLLFIGAVVFPFLIRLDNAFALTLVPVLVLVTAFGYVAVLRRLFPSFFKTKE
jgi:hypothetical protein